MPVLTHWKPTVVSSGNVGASLSFYDKSVGRGARHRLIVLWDPAETDCAVESSAGSATSGLGSLTWDLTIGSEPKTIEFRLTRKAQKPRRPSIAAVVVDWDEPHVQTDLLTFDWD